MSRNEILLIAGMAAVTFAIRYLFFALGDKVVFPPLVQRALRYVPVAVLTAITVPMVLLPDGQHWQLDWHNPWLIGCLCTGCVAWFSRHLLSAIAIGMLVYLGWRMLLT